MSDEIKDFHGKIDKKVLCKYEQSHFGWPPGETQDCVFCERDKLRQRAETAEAMVDEANLSFCKSIASVAGWKENKKIAELKLSLATAEQEIARLREQIPIVDELFTLCASAAKRLVDAEQEIDRLRGICRDAESKIRDGEFLTPAGEILANKLREADYREEIK